MLQSKFSFSVFALILLLASLSLIACGNAANTAGSETGSDGGLTVEQLALGSLKLEETDAAIDQDQAQALLTLWVAYRSLLDDDATAEAELQGLVEQIAETMTAEQRSTIATMNLDDERIQAEMAALAARFRAAKPRGDRNRGPGPLAGGPPGRDPAARGGANPGQRNADARATALAERPGDDPAAIRTFRRRALATAVIHLLQDKTGLRPTPPPLTLNPRLVARLAAASRVDEAELQAALDAGASLSEAIVENGGDLDAAKTLLRNILGRAYGLEGEALEQKVMEFME